LDKLMQVFENMEFGQIRTMVIDDKPYAVGNDIASALDYVRPYEAVTAHCKGAVIHRVIDNLGRAQDTRVIPEGDIYRLIVKAADQSANPEIKTRATRFERWIFDEVLPQIRKTGQYSIQPLSKLQQIQQGYEALMGLVEEMRPKAEYFDALVDRNLLANFRDTAKELKIKETPFIDWLTTNKYIYRNQKHQIRPYADHTPELLELKDYINPRNGHPGQQTLITPKGRETFRLLLIKDNLIDGR